MVSLDNSQKDQLLKWKEELNCLNNQQLKTENDLKSFENLALDVDGAKKQVADLKVEYDWRNVSNCGSTIDFL